MIYAGDVNLIIFDVDGTILPTTKPVMAAINRTFMQAGWPVRFNETDVESFFGTPAGELYRFIAPEGEPWEGVREMVRREYPAAFREFASAYPGVKETLAALRRRGYRLALYSNASIQYFDMVVDALGIRDYFDYAECIGENDLTKPELVRKIRRRFGGLKAAVVGDRIHDIEAARETGSLSVGVLYGFGGGEPEQADVTIEEFKDLLSIFDRRLRIFRKLLEAVGERKRPDRAYVIGINGIDTSGKTLFTEALARFLVMNGQDVQVINLDDFHNPRRIRNSGEDPLESYYHRGFDIGTLVDSLLVPLGQKDGYSVSLTLLDLRTDRYEKEKTFSFTGNTIVLLEGVYLFRKELAGYIDYKLFLDIPFEESRIRAAERDVPLYGDEILSKYDEKYLPVQSRYLEEYSPWHIADMVIDNTHWEYPVITRIR